MTDSIQNDVQAIHTIRERTMHAENIGDADFFDSACTADFVVMPPNMPAVVGRGAAVGFMREFLSQFDLSIRYVSEETQIHGDIAFDRGTYSQSLTPKAGGTPIPEKGKFFWLYSRGSDGSWKMSRVIWNASEPSPSQ
jgi:ketosteroid isomerase-like protein